MMDIATMTDAASVPGTDVYYLYRIYIMVSLIFILIIVWLFSSKLRSMYNKLADKGGKE